MGKEQFFDPRQYYPDISGSAGNPMPLISDDRIREVSVELFKFAQVPAETRMRTNIMRIVPMEGEEFDLWQDTFDIIGSTVDDADAGRLFVSKNEEQDEMFPQIEYRKHDDMEPAEINSPYFFFLPIVRVGGDHPEVVLDLYIGVKDDNKRWVVDKREWEARSAPNSERPEIVNQSLARQTPESQEEAGGYYPYYPIMIQFHVKKNSTTSIHFYGSKNLHFLSIRAVDVKSLRKTEVSSTKEMQVLFWTLERLLKRNAIPAEGRVPLPGKEPAISPDMLRMLEGRQQELKRLQKPEEPKEEE